mgnify:CR=1 FL=1
MAFCVIISGKDNKIGRIIYDQWKYYRDTYAQISTVDSAICSEDFDDTEEWAMTEYEFRDWYFTHSHKETMAFYNFFMEDCGNFKKIAPQVVEKELYNLWKNDPQLFTDMLQNFEDEDVEEYTFN